MKSQLSLITMATVAATLAVGGGSERVDAADRKARQADKQAAGPVKPGDNAVVEAAPMLKSVESISPNRLRLVWEWNVGSRPNEDWLVFVHFADTNGEANFARDFQPDPPTSSWQPGTVELAPSEAVFPVGLTGTFDIRVGLYQREAGRARIDGATEQGWVVVGQVTLEDGKSEFVPAQ